MWKIHRNNKKVFTGSYDKCLAYAASKNFRILAEDHPARVINVEHVTAAAS